MAHRADISMFRRALAAYGKGLDATVRLIGMGIATSVIGWGINVTLQAIDKALPPHLDWLTIVVLLLAFPFLARLILAIGGLTVSKSREKLSPPEPPPSPRSLPAGR